MHSLDCRKKRNSAKSSKMKSRKAQKLIRGKEAEEY